MLEIETANISGIGIFKDGELSAFVLNGGKPKHYVTIEMGNGDMEKLYEVDKAQLK